jgi:diacylglycerol kinase family enzyme
LETKIKEVTKVEAVNKEAVLAEVAVVAVAEENANLEPHAKTETQLVNSTILTPLKFQTVASAIKTAEDQTVAQSQIVRTGPTPSATVSSVDSPITFQEQRIQQPTLRLTLSCQHR